MQLQTNLYSRQKIVCIQIQIKPNTIFDKDNI